MHQYSRKSQALSGDPLRGLIPGGISFKITIKRNDKFINFLSGDNFNYQNKNQESESMSSRGRILPEVIETSCSGGRKTGPKTPKAYIPGSFLFHCRIRCPYL